MANKIQINIIELVESLYCYVNDEPYPTFKNFCNKYKYNNAKGIERKGISRSRLYQLISEAKELLDTNKKQRELDAYEFAKTELEEIQKLLIQNQQDYLERQALLELISVTMAIFLLKQPQHGYTDKQTIDATVEIKESKISETIQAIKDSK